MPYPSSFRESPTGLVKMGRAQKRISTSLTVFNSDVNDSIVCLQESNRVIASGGMMPECQNLPTMSGLGGPRRHECSVDRDRIWNRWTVFVSAAGLEQVWSLSARF